MTAPVAAPLLEARGLTVRGHGGFAAGAAVTVLRDISFHLDHGGTLAVVGESGAGKSTLVRALLGLLAPHAGQVLIDGEDLAGLPPARLRARRRRVQIVFQDPLASLDPAMTVLQIVADHLGAADAAQPPARRRELVVEQLEAVGLGAEFLGRRPAQLSGGQAQRVAIARALLARPAGLICDEPVSALDMSLRAQVLRLLAEQCRRRQLALLFVTHDLHAARLLCARTLVLRRGAVVEAGATAGLFASPQRPYTRELLESTLTVDVARLPDSGTAA